MFGFTCCCSENNDEFSVNVDERQRPSTVLPTRPSARPSAVFGQFHGSGLDEKNYYTVVLMRDGNGSLDLSIEKSDAAYVMLKGMTQPVADWNRRHPDTEILVFDRIVAVNGQVASGKDLARALQVAFPIPHQTVALMLQRPVERHVALKRPGKLGLTTNLMPKDSVMPWIDQIAEGLLHQWNLSNPDAAVREHDRIISVNGVSEPPTAVALQLTKDVDVELTVLHYFA